MPADDLDMYAAAVEPTPAEVPRWARGAAIALVTAPGVLLAQLVTSSNAPSVGACLLAAAAVAAVACLLPSGGGRFTAAVAAAAQLAGHLVLAVAVPSDAGGEGCLAVVGRGAGALVNPSAACPPGAASPGWWAVGAAVLTAAGAAVLVLAGSGALAALAAGLVAGVVAAAVAVRELLAGVRVALVDGAVLRVPVLAVLRTPAPAPAPLRSVWLPGTPARRGPPAVHATV